MKQIPLLIDNKKWRQIRYSDPNVQYAWMLIKYYASHFGITCPIQFKVKNLNSSLGRCGLYVAEWHCGSRSGVYDTKGDPFPRPYVYIVLEKDLVEMKRGRAKLHHVIIHELIHGTGNHSHNKHFYETARQFNIEIEYENYQAFKACHK